MMLLGHGRIQSIIEICSVLASNSTMSTPSKQVRIGMFALLYP